MDDREKAIRIEHARKEYVTFPQKHVTVVDDVSISVEQGSIHGLLGPNGAGKTTTLKMLLGLVRPTAGTFEILGRPAHVSGARSRLGFLPEQPYFSPQLKAAEVMRLYGRLVGLGGPFIREEIGRLMPIVGLEGREKTTLSKFSRGMLQRLGVAQALIGSPEVVILDEPASGLDPVGQRDMRNLMLSLREEGTTVLLSSHQLSEVEAICDRVTILNRGRVAAEGHIDDLLNVAGQTSMRVRGLETLPASLGTIVTDVAVSGGVSVFSVPDDQVRAAVDAIDDAGGRVESITPKRSSLEDYFARLLAETGESVDEGVA